VSAEDLPEDVHVAETILQGNNMRLLWQETRKSLNGCTGFPCLDTDKDRIRRTRWFSGDDWDLDGGFPVDSFNGDAFVVEQAGALRPVIEEGGLVPRHFETARKEAAHGTWAHNEKMHFSAFLQLCSFLFSA
jgi:hypothetical protein